MTEPQNAVEPQAAAPASAGGEPAPGTGNAGQSQEPPNLEQLQQENESLKSQVAELEPLRGWQPEYTRIKQAGLDEVYQGLAADQRNPEGVKAYIEGLRQAGSVLQELGGPDAVKAKVAGYNSVDDGSFWQTMTAEPTPTPTQPPAPSSPAPQPSSVGREPAPQQGLTTEQVTEIVRRTMTEQANAEALEDAKNDAAAQLARSAGLAGEDGQASPQAVALYRGSLNQAISGLTNDGFGNTRDVTPDDIGQAAAMVEQTIITPARASGVELANQPNQPAVPPATNGPGAGAQQPGKSLGEMDEGEINAHIAADYEAAVAAIPPSNAPALGRPSDENPSNWSFGGQ